MRSRHWPRPEHHRAVRERLRPRCERSPAQADGDCRTSPLGSPEGEPRRPQYEQGPAPRLRRYQGLDEGTRLQEREVTMAGKHIGFEAAAEKAAKGAGVSKERGRAII